MANLNITESMVFATLRTFLLSILPDGVEVIRGQDNRVGEPEGADFVVMTPHGRKRLASNIVSYSNNVFTASITGTTLTVSDIESGTLAIGSQIWGSNIAPNTIITTLGSGTGGNGTYTVSVAQTVGSETMHAGTSNSLQSTEVTIQLDVHGPFSADNSQLISSLFMDAYGYQVIASQGADIAPLYCSDPVQVAFVDAEQQYEDKYSIEVQLQVNTIVQTPVQFAQTLGPVNVIDVDATYSPS